MARCVHGYDSVAGTRLGIDDTSGTSLFAYDGDNLIEETNSSGAVVARYTQMQNIDQPLAMLRSSTTSYYQVDGLGSITSRPWSRERSHTRRPAAQRHI
jgi:hypothetical protein